ncbi:MAG: NAD(P)H-binding protein [Chloroflexi bacterium]|nr:NAD(P)H-binding protein [Chloroflexota bacterium]
MILVTGASGKTGLAVIRALANQDQPVRAFIHRADQAAKAKHYGASEIMVGDLLNKENLNRAFQGIRAVYHICPNVNPHELEIGRNAIDFGRANEIEHFVFHSVLHPQIEAMPHHWNKMRVEEILINSGLAFTILQPGAYMQNILSQWSSIIELGIYSVPYSKETRISMVDLEDIAEAAASVLGNSQFFGGTFELVGSDHPSQVEIAGILSSRLERPVIAEQLDINNWKVNAKNSGLGNFQIETLMKMFEYYEKHNFAGNPHILSSLLNRLPTKFDDFVDRIITQKLSKQQ